MSEHGSESEKPMMSPSKDPDTSVSRAQGKFLGRRAVIKAVLATTPIVMTIKSRPVSAETTPNAQNSARLSARPQPA